MAVTIIDPYDAQMPFPIDLRFRRNSIEDRDAMPSNIRWEGMPVYVMNEEAWFYLKGGLTNEFWEPWGAGDEVGLQNVYFNSTEPTTQGVDGDIWFRPFDDTVQLYQKVGGVWTMLGDWGSGGGSESIEDDGISFDQTSATLNGTYPDMPIGGSVYSNTNNVVYTKKTPTRWSMLSLI